MVIVNFDPRNQSRSLGGGVCLVAALTAAGFLRHRYEQKKRQHLYDEVWQTPAPFIYPRESTILSPSSPPDAIPMKRREQRRNDSNQNPVDSSVQIQPISETSRCTQ